MLSLPSSLALLLASASALEVLAADSAVLSHRAPIQRQRRSRAHQKRCAAKNLTASVTTSIDVASATASSTSTGAALALLQQAPSSISSATATDSSTSVDAASTDSAAASLSLSLSAAVASSTVSASSSSGGSGGTPLASKHVFAHFMVGIVSTYALQDWVNDMTLAKSYGITGFALNIGTDPYTDAQLDLAYQAGSQVGDFSLFISFDFNWYNLGDTSQVATLIQKYGGESAQLLVDGKVFVSTFIGDGFDWASVASQSGRQLEVVPYWEPTASNADNGALGGLFSWCAWPGQITNTPVQQNMTTEQDELYLSVLDPQSKPYMMPVSPWFFTHFGPEVSYSKNWLFYSETLWMQRWQQVLDLSDQVNYVEIVTWNDYGESHNIAPYGLPHTDDGSSRWSEGLDHTGMMALATPYINAFKTGAKSPVFDNEMVVFWHRPHLKSATCDATDNCGTKPTGWEMVDDAVFLTTFTHSGGQVAVSSGGQTSVIPVGAGVQTFSVPMRAGLQQVALQTNDGAVGTKQSNVTVSAGCWNGIYNFNFHSEALIL